LDEIFSLGIALEGVAMDIVQAQQMQAGIHHPHKEFLMAPEKGITLSRPNDDTTA